MVMEDSKMIEKEEEENNNTGSALDFSPKFKRDLLETLPRPTTKGIHRLVMRRTERITTVYPNPTPKQLKNCTYRIRKKKKSIAEEADDLTKCFLALTEEHDKLTESLKEQGVSGPIEENPAFIALEKRALPLEKRHLALKNRIKKEHQKEF